MDEKFWSLVSGLYCGSLPPNEGVYDYLALLQSNTLLDVQRRFFLIDAILVANGQGDLLPTLNPLRDIEINGCLDLISGIPTGYTTRQEAERLHRQLLVREPNEDPDLGLLVMLEEAMVDRGWR